MDRPLFIPVLLGSSRAERKSGNVAQFVISQIQAKKIQSELLDVRTMGLPFYEEEHEKLPAAKQWSETMQRADGLIVVSPEYNHSFPGVLKNTLDYLYDEYLHKPIGIVGTSCSQMGGVRMIEQLRLVAIELHMVPIRHAVYFGEMGKKFDENGKLLDEAYIERVDKMLDELLWYARVLKKGREET
ncbi:MAG: NADPH-dependent FMN reductase [bacterium]|nr:NADPH-dependent FMN reductase [bacterium]